MCHALCPCPRGEGILVRRRRCFHGLAELLSHSATDQSANHIPNDDSSNAPVRLLQCNQSSESQNAVNAWGMRAVASCWPIWNNEWVSRMLSKTGLRWSVVIPDKPAAAPLLDDLKLDANLWASNAKLSTG